MYMCALGPMFSWGTLPGGSQTFLGKNLFTASVGVDRHMTLQYQIYQIYPMCSQILEIVLSSGQKATMNQNSLAFHVYLMFPQIGKNIEY